MQEKISKLFGVPAPDAATVPVRDAINGLPAEVYPEQDKNYVFDPLLLKKMIRFFLGGAARRNLLFIGEPGVGKSSLALEMASRLGWPVWSLACSGKTRFAHMIGSYRLSIKDGASITVWEDGPLLNAMRHGGVFLANEITRLDAGEQMNLAEVLDASGTITVPDTGEVVKAHPMFRFIATGNTGGYGDTAGAYPGERASSLAFLDRFQKFQVDHLSAEQEMALIGKVAPKLPEILVKPMLKLAEEIRKNFIGRGGNLRVVLSTRSLLVWAREAESYALINGLKDPAREALLDTVVNGTPDEERKTVLELWDFWVANPSATKT